MTHTLLLRLAGPMQSWGTQSHFSRRDTGLEPSKSGVVGLLCAALGRPRDQPMDDLAALRMGVRVDCEGVLQMDYHTVGAVARGTESHYGVASFNGGHRPVLSRRAYLASASFLVGLEGATRSQEELLRQLDVALAHPVWPLYLGRKAFPPAGPVRLPDAPPHGPGLRAGAVRDALLQYPWPADRDQPLRFILEDVDGSSGETRQDTPVSFLPLNRRYAPRFVTTEFHSRPATTIALDVL